MATEKDYQDTIDEFHEIAAESFILLDWINAVAEADLSPFTCQVLLKVFSRVERHIMAWPRGCEPGSLDKIAREIGATRQQVAKALQEAAKAKLLRVMSKSGPLDAHAAGQETRTAFLLSMPDDGPLLIYSEHRERHKLTGGLAEFVPYPP